jgi:glycosyltransferase involved in cell wall biosynthesis
VNLLVCTNLDVRSPNAAAAIPRPRTSPRTPGQPPRILFINGLELGFGTTSRNLEALTATRPDVEAVHFSVRMPLWLRAACWETPLKDGRVDLQAFRTMHAWAALLRPLLTGPLSLDRFDVVHVLTQQRALAPARLISRGPARPRLVVNVDATLSGWDRTFEVHTHATPLQLRLERSIYRAAVDSGGAIACASRWVADSIIADSGIPQDRVFLHMPCAHLPPGATPRRPDAHLDRPGPLRMVFVGNAWVRKGGPRLLRWHQQRWADRAELHVCSGEAPRDKSCRNVVWHGRVEHDRLICELLPTMDLFVAPTHEDTFLIAAQEAQALGLPVVSSRLAGIPEVVLDGDTGMLCPRGDDPAFIAAIERLLGDPALLVRFSAAAAAHAHHNLNADVWHNHLLDQLVALADNRPVMLLPRSGPPHA